jgi:hypothetical protein
MTLSVASAPSGGFCTGLKARKRLKIHKNSQAALKLREPGKQGQTVSSAAEHDHSLYSESRLQRAALALRGRVEHVNGPQRARSRRARPSPFAKDLRALDRSPPCKTAWTFRGTCPRHTQIFDAGVTVFGHRPGGRLFSSGVTAGASELRSRWQGALASDTRPSRANSPRNRVVSRLRGKRSRLLVLDVNTNANPQLNYGTGADLSDDSLADVARPHGQRPHRTRVP